MRLIIYYNIYESQCLKTKMEREWKKQQAFYWSAEWGANSA